MTTEALAATAAAASVAAVKFRGGLLCCSFLLLLLAFLLVPVSLMSPSWSERSELAAAISLIRRDHWDGDDEEGDEAFSCCCCCVRCAKSASPLANCRSSAQRSRRSNVKDFLSWWSSASAFPNNPTATVVSICSCRIASSSPPSSSISPTV
eukprot:CAMPEP_0171963232 /NCGR_PEP_ID=MMETSP0993-20121228/174254_1 /TAXON_ID=483369 /ORGANISM="non described non described, Strain CCMP2098" /LENGTH=151 /DNA_ID=CAMNT_0012611761 /DNA_START=93 /DNA_END=548 /DNA_ORIENTATION=+